MQQIVSHKDLAKIWYPIEVAEVDLRPLEVAEVAKVQTKKNDQKSWNRQFLSY